jgi:hypothetical protein
MPIIPLPRERNEPPHLPLVWNASPVVGDRHRQTCFRKRKKRENVRSLEFSAFGARHPLWEGLGAHNRRFLAETAITELPQVTPLLVAQKNSPPPPT